MIKYWDREFPNQSEPLEKQVEKLQSVFATDMTQAVAHLTQIIITLEEYAALAPPPGAIAEAGTGDDDASAKAGATDGETATSATESGDKKPSEEKDL